ncbi:HD domain-containing protein [Alkalihalophilus pseudofirmus]|uniref:HD domain-containing protein n=1 Tax=Alkalihalophilus pseudofirmus TaxID=79885 RepID=A0AAJ2U1Q1_ALKPS|nr:HD domain-containing protein [Alkalihalophilus pseudofirmus]MDV2885597.1 HD domain-containing protein [Alkalihalophilus pseudofirmus]
MNKGIIEKTEKWVKAQLINEESGHDWYHILRVTRTAQQIAKEEHANDEIVTLAALVHDLADDKVVQNEKEALKKIDEWFKENGLDDEAIDQIISIITTISFKGGNGQPVTTLEGKIVQDADRLDALGAIGIARTFVYSGHKGQPMYDPELPVRNEMSLEEYRHGKSSAVHHFYEKLLQLKDQMNTTTGMKLAARRHAFMETYLEQFYSEWG